jgi:hypothetical protein
MSYVGSKSQSTKWLLAEKNFSMQAFAKNDLISAQISQ